MNKYKNIIRLVAVALICILFKVTGGTIWGFVPVSWSMAISPIIILGIVTFPDIIKEMKN